MMVADESGIESDSAILARIETRLASLEAGQAISNETQKASNEAQTRTILALIGVIAATLGVRFTETDISGEAMIAGSYLMVIGSVLLAGEWWRERKRLQLGPSIGFLVIGLVGFGLPAMVFGRFWLEDWMVGILRGILAIGMSWLAIDLIHWGRAKGRPAIIEAIKENH